MRALIVYESLYGTNRLIAQAIAAGFGTNADVAILEAHSAPSSIGDDVDIIVVGGPNHMTALPSPGSRAEAAKEGNGQAQPGGSGLREWIGSLRLSRCGQATAVWDTRMIRPRILALFDHGARQIAAGLKRAGANSVCKPEKFYSSDGVGALVAGEEERARAWGATLAATMRCR
jgi:hypothetical protein